MVLGGLCNDIDPCLNEGKCLHLLTFWPKANCLYREIFLLGCGVSMLSKCCVPLKCENIELKGGGQKNTF